MTKKFRIIIVTNILIISFILITSCFALSPKYQNELRNGCYMSSKQYLGTDKAKGYCECTVQLLSKKFNDKEIDVIFKKEPNEIIKDTEFAAIYCQKKLLNF